MTNDRLTDLLAVKVLGWKVCPDRFIQSGRRWIPKWRFAPLMRMDDAFLLLEKSGGTYLLSLDAISIFTAEVRIGERIGKASGEPKAHVITLALSKALGIGTV